jgi:hypothetical protein
MKKICFNQNELFQIAKIIKDHFPGLKVFLHRHQEKIVLVFPKNIDRLRIEELKTLLKIRCPSYQIIFHCE